MKLFSELLMSTAAATLLLSSRSMVAASAAPPSAAQIAEIVYWHNAARAEIARSGYCANMLYADWDTSVATAAQSNVCPTTHNGAATTAFGSYLGENLAWASGGSCTTGLCAAAGNCGGTNQPACESGCGSTTTAASSYCTIKSMVYDGWYQSEATNKYSIPNNCLSYNGGGGHCSQVNWQSSTGIGCAYQTGCSSWDYTLNCNYNPAGNFNIPNFNTVYLGACVTGTACSACPSTYPYCISSGPFQGLCSKTASATTSPSIATTVVVATTAPATTAPATTAPATTAPATTAKASTAPATNTTTAPTTTTSPTTTRATTTPTPTTPTPTTPSPTTPTPTTPTPTTLTLTTLTPTTPTPTTPTLTTPAPTTIKLTTTASPTTVITTVTPSTASSTVPPTSAPSTAPPTTQLPSVTLADVALHSTNQSCWIVIYSIVYDVTSYAVVHPGGIQTILNNCGTDATVAYVGGSITHIPAKLGVTVPAVAKLVTAPTTLPPTFVPSTSVLPTASTPTPSSSGSSLILNSYQLSYSFFDITYTSASFGVSSSVQHTDALVPALAVMRGVDFQLVSGPATTVRYSQCDLAQSSCSTNQVACTNANTTSTACGSHVFIPLKKANVMLQVEADNQLFAISVYVQTIIN